MTEVPPRAALDAAGDRRLLLILAALIVVVVANNSSGSVAQPAIAAHFGAGPADVGWVVFGYSGSFAVATALWGGLGARYGVGPLISLGVLLFAAASAVAALAPSLEVVIASRIVQGLGSGAVPTLSAALIARRFEGPSRARALGTNIAAVALGLIAGPIVGGLSLQVLGWRAAVAFGILSAPAAWFLWQYERQGNRAFRLDLPGAAVVAIGAFAATFLLNRLPVVGLSPILLVPMALVVVALVALARRSVRPHAFLPRHVIGVPTFYRIALLGAIGMSAFLGSITSVPVAASAAHGLSGINLGLLLTPMALASAVVSVQNARVQERLGRPLTTVLSLAALAAGTVALAALATETPPFVTALCLVPLGIGFALLGSPLLAELTRRFEGRDQPVAVGAYNLVFFLGGAIGASVSSALLQARAELPLLAGRHVPGYASVSLLLALGPAIAALLVASTNRRGSAPSARG